MNKEWEEVKLFHEKFNHPVGKCPKGIEKERAKKRYNWDNKTGDMERSA